jgi:hypothetical protein
MDLLSFVFARWGMAVQQREFKERERVTPLQ